MDATLIAMKALIASCTELFSIMVESSEDGEISSSYSDLTPKRCGGNSRVATEGRNQPIEEEDQVEDIMALTAPPISATQVVVPNAAHTSSTSGKAQGDHSMSS
jgi:hypothetical protein